MRASKGSGDKREGARLKWHARVETQPVRIPAGVGEPEYLARRREEQPTTHSGVPATFWLTLDVHA